MGQGCRPRPSSMTAGDIGRARGGARRGRPPAKGRRLTEDQVEAVAMGIQQEEYRTLVYVLAYGGLGWGEACGLRRRRCDLLRSRVEVVESLPEISGRFVFGEPKTYARRWVRSRNSCWRCWVPTWRRRSRPTLSPWSSPPDDGPHSETRIFVGESGTRT